MARSRLIGALVALSMAGLAAWSFGITAAEKAPGQERTPPKAKPSDKGLGHFMRLKLEASGKVLEGLAVEDFALVKEGAQKLNTMSTAEKWRVSNDALYRNFSGDFQRITRELVKAAEEENLDRAALKWMDATMSCIECHRYARGIMIAWNEPPKEVQP